MIGTILGNYRLRAEIGRGGMGAVYVADHLHLSRQVALKVLLPELCADPQAVRRLFQEARATSLIRHPGIVEVFDCDAPRPDVAYLVMELLVGETLASYQHRVGALPASAPMLELGAQIADALAAAHVDGIFHRDLKPDNVFLTGTRAPDHIKVLDFGIAKLTAGSAATGRTRTGVVMGTPIYMSPEQCRGTGAVDHRTDIYSLGCLLFEAWCRRPPFVREGGGELLVAHISEPPPDPRAFAPDLPAELAALALACLAKDPAARPQSMPALAARLRQAAARAPGQALPALDVRDFSRDLPWQGKSEVATVTPMSPLPAIPTPGGTRALPNEESERRSGSGSGSGSGNVARAGSSAGAPVTTFGHTAAEKLDGVGPGRAGSRSRRLALTVAIAAVTTIVAGAAGRWLYTRSVSETAARAPADEGAPATIVVEVEGAPPGLVIKVDGHERRPPVELPMADTTHLFEFAAPGFTPQRLRFDARRSRVVTLAMQPEAPPATAGTDAKPVDRPAPQTATPAAPAAAKKNDAREPTRKRPKPPSAESFRRFDDI